MTETQLTETYFESADLGIAPGLPLSAVHTRCHQALGRGRPKAIGPAREVVVIQVSRRQVLGDRQPAAASDVAGLGERPASPVSAMVGLPFASLPTHPPGGATRDSATPQLTAAALTNQVI
jgi:hypothetical protein